MRIYFPQKIILVCHLERSCHKRHARNVAFVLVMARGCALLGVPSMRYGRQRRCRRIHCQTHAMRLDRCPHASSMEEGLIKGHPSGASPWHVGLRVRGQANAVCLILVCQPLAHSTKCPVWLKFCKLGCDDGQLAFKVIQKSHSIAKLSLCSAW